MYSISGVAYNFSVNGSNRKGIKGNIKHKKDNSLNFEYIDYDLNASRVVI